MNTARNYLLKHAPGNALIKEKPETGLSFIVVIPAYIETRLEKSLVSLLNAYNPSCPVEIIILINWPAGEIRENIDLSRKIYEETLAWSIEHSSSLKKFHPVLSENVPTKKAGVGFARKTGMDEAVRRFVRAGSNEGVIISFDADAICEPGYFNAIEEHFTRKPGIDGCTIYFEHPLEGDEFIPEVYKAIRDYELHLRYYLQSLRYTGLPNVFHTVGSAFAVRLNSYCSQGGMNTRKAGEDFYFLQKLFELGNFSELSNTTVIPSPRPSLRVPFGTGKTIHHVLETGESKLSYQPEIFEILRSFFASLPDIYMDMAKTGRFSIPGIHPSLTEFLNLTEFEKGLLSVYKHSSSENSFRKRFFRYFNMFRVLKFVHYSRKWFPDKPVDECARNLLVKLGYPDIAKAGLLEMYRKIDKNFSVPQ